MPLLWTCYGFPASYAVPLLSMTGILCYAVALDVWYRVCLWPASAARVRCADTRRPLAGKLVVDNPGRHIKVRAVDAWCAHARVHVACVCVCLCTRVCTSVCARMHVQAPHRRESVCARAGAKVRPDAPRAWRPQDARRLLLPQPRLRGARVAWRACLASCTRTQRGPSSHPPLPRAASLQPDMRCARLAATLLQRPGHGQHSDSGATLPRCRSLTHRAGRCPVC